ncbi:MAG: hypothetical protein AAGJ28_21190 [Pseudomonadota bacterium]
MLNLLAALAVRFFGFICLIPCTHGLVVFLLPVLGGQIPAVPFNLAHGLAFLVCWLLVAFTFLHPGASRRRLRRRLHPIAWFFQRCVILLILLSGILSAIAQTHKQSFWPYWLDDLLILSALPILIILITGLVWPGWYATTLARQYWAARGVETAWEVDDHWDADDDRPGQPAPRYAASPDDLTGRAALLAAVQRRSEDREHFQKTTHPPLTLRKSLMAAPFVAVMAVPIFVLFAGIIGAQHSHFLPLAAHRAFAEQNYLTLVLGLAGACALISAMNRNSEVAPVDGPFSNNRMLALYMASNRAIRSSLGNSVRSSIAKLFFGFLFGFVLTILYGKAFIAVGLPVIHSQFTDRSPASVSVTVVEVGKRIKRRGCNRRLYVRVTGKYSVPEALICDVPEHMWERAQPGDTLRLDGFETPFGFRYQAYRM